tara:strand:+ start:188 stop:928 length:741 start_codon:yes stop_codon:yes gene_type:complete
MKILSDLLLHLENLIFPPSITCNGCGKDLDMEISHRYDLCDVCIDQISWVKGKTCKACGGPLPQSYPQEICYNCMKKINYFTQVEACFLYDGLGKQLIMDLKYNRKTYLGQSLANMMYDVASTCFAEPIDLVVSVPLHKKRLAERGFNQMDLVGEPLSEKLEVQYNPEALIRNVNTPRLKNLDRKKRMDIMETAFLAQQSYVLGKRVLIIDDIYTTGATMNACAKVLLEAGALNVYGLALSVNFRD